MTTTLEFLEIPPDKLQMCRDDISRMAYFKWIAAGCPQGRDVDFWTDAEREWVEFKYVPDRGAAAE